MPPALHIIHHIPPPMQTLEESEPRVWPNQPSGAATPGRPAEMDKAPKPRPFRCGICRKRFTQSQVRYRHFRAHKPSWCIFCDAPWSRSYLYRVHLERYHSDVDIDAGSRVWSGAGHDLEYISEAMQRAFMERGKGFYPMNETHHSFFTLFHSPGLEARLD